MTTDEMLAEVRRQQGQLDAITENLIEAIILRAERNEPGDVEEIVVKARTLHYRLTQQATK